MTPDPKDFLAARPIIHWSRKARINRIYRGVFAGHPEPVGFTDVGIWPFGPKGDPALLETAERSGNRPRQTRAGRWAKRVFLRWQHNWCLRYLARHPDSLVVVWNGIKGHRRLLADAAVQSGRPVVYFEEAPLPGRITMDFEGVNHGCSLPRDIRFYHAWAERERVNPQAWRRLRAELMARRSDRADVAQKVALDDLKGGPFLFCPLQVPGDSQITVYGDWIRSVDHMIEEVARAAEALPEGWHLRIKEHPSARAAFGDRLRALAGPKLRIDNEIDTFAQVAASSGVLSVNSSVGLQAFFFDKPVICLGQAFYAFGNMAQHARSPEALRMLLSFPNSLIFDGAARDAFMSYLDRAYYPREVDVKAGRYGLRDLIERDRQRDLVLSALGAARAEQKKPAPPVAA